MWIIDVRGGVLLIKIISVLAIAIELIGIAIIVWGSALVAIRVVSTGYKCIKKERHFDQWSAVRKAYGAYLMLGLQFLVAADILLTIVHPSLKEIGLLAAIVLIRAVIGYTIGREMAEVTEE